MAKESPVQINNCRVAELVDLIRKHGASSSTLHKYCHDKFQVSQATSYKLIKRARETIRDEFENIDRIEFTSLQVQRLELIYERAMITECYPSAVGALKELNSMLGIGYTAKR